MFILNILALICVAFMILLYLKDRTSLLLPFFLLFALGFGGASLFAYGYTNNNPLIVMPLLALLLFMLFVLVFGIYILIAFLFFNAHSILRKEGFSLSNSLTLILAIALTAGVIVSLFIDPTTLPPLAKGIRNALYVVAFLYFCHLSLFFLGDFLLNISPVRKNKDYVIVLGAGLIDGNVGKLLAARIERAIKFYHQQEAKGIAPPLLIMSGGQGLDEPRSEASAMAEYARDQGIPAEHIICEDKSRNTQENMELSKVIMDRRSGAGNYKAVYATSNYHLFRAGVYAKRAGLNIHGLGARTAFYYLPSAVLREYIAFFWLQKKGLIIVGLALFLLITFAVTGVNLPSLQP